ncbi:MAG TPA: hypothetical protein VGX23_26305 [Actinocrinis sp.]|nr:hypothetical protein [Actinocrinis sp.]
MDLEVKHLQQSLNERIAPFVERDDPADLLAPAALADVRAAMLLAGGEDEPDGDLAELLRLAAWLLTFRMEAADDGTAAGRARANVDGEQAAYLFALLYPAMPDASPMFLRPLVAALAGTDLADGNPGARCIAWGASLLRGAGDDAAGLLLDRSIELLARGLSLPSVAGRDRSADLVTYASALWRRYESGAGVGDVADTADPDGFGSRGDLGDLGDLQRAVSAATEAATLASSDETVALIQQNLAVMLRELDERKSRWATEAVRAAVEKPRMQR